MAGMDSRTDPGVPDSVRKMEKVNQKSLPERTADAVMSMLHHENYGVGQKLPNEIKMAERFEVSRSTIRQADLILVVKDGKIIEEGSHRELLRQKGYYYDLYSRQFEEESAMQILAGEKGI